MSWVIFAVIVLGLLALDLGFFQRSAHQIGVREALLMSAFWIGVALIFNIFIYFSRGPEDALLFFTGYVVEKSLSVDNLFVFLVVFSYFGIPGQYQHRVLFWGILGALITRGFLIWFGITLISRFHWMTYALGAFLVLTGIKAAFSDAERLEPEKNPVVRVLRRFLPVVSYFDEGKFFVKEKGKVYATPVFVALLVIEFTDVVFALDSVPAILAITLDPFIVYASNIFAILGLRALFFALAAIMPLFRFLKYGVSLVLVLVGVKMLLGEHLGFSEQWLLLGTVGLLGGSVAVSIFYPEQPAPPELASLLEGEKNEH